MVMEKSWNMKSWPKVIQFCDQSWNFTNFAPKFDQICISFVTSKKLSSNLENPHFQTFSAKCRKFKIGKRDGHGKSRNGHGKIMETYFVKYMGTLFTESSQYSILLSYYNNDLIFPYIATCLDPGTENCTVTVVTAEVSRNLLSKIYEW